ncbi:MAG: T9SS type A sorting domain-containing protein [Bacteroidota bacterium]
MNSIEIYNVLGEKVYQSSIAGHQSFVIDISKEPKGLYFVKVYLLNENHTGKEKIYIGKLMIQ